MTLISLSEISQLIQQESVDSLFLQSTDFYSISSLQQQFQLIVKQKYLEIPIEPILRQYPLLADWIRQLETFIPSLFNPNKQIYLELLLKARLSISKNQEYWIETPVNLAFIKGKSRLIEWSIRQPKLNFQDQIKLWVTTQSLNLSPQNLTITLCSFNLESQPVKKNYRWSKQQHLNIQRKLKLLLSNKHFNSQSTKVQPESLNVELLTLLDIDNIEEIPI